MSGSQFGSPWVGFQGDSLDGRLGSDVRQGPGVRRPETLGQGLSPVLGCFSAARVNLTE